MEYNKKKIILIFILIIVILGVIFIVKTINIRSGNTQSIAKSKYSKSELIDLINSKTNKNNYEVEYETNGNKYKIKYLNRKMKFEASNGEGKVLSYIDFENMVNTIINEENKIVVKTRKILTNEYYMPDDIFQVLEEPDCRIKGEEKILNRDAIVLNYNGKFKTGDQFFFSADNSVNINNKIDELKYNIKFWVDKESGLLLQTVIKANNQEIKTVYNLKTNTVTEADVTEPDLSQYKITDATPKQ